MEEFLNKLFPKLLDELKRAQMQPDIVKYIRNSSIITFIFALNFTVITFVILSKIGYTLLTIPFFFVYFLGIFYIGIKLPKMMITKVRLEIESDIFVPSRKLLTLLESGNSLITALVGTSYTNAKSSKYFGKIASEIFLGKNIEEAIEDAIKYTPSESFRRVLEPIKKSLKTGTDIQSSLQVTLNDLAKQKVIEIEEYEKKLGPLSMFYMIFGTIVPTIGTVGLVLVVSIIGREEAFIPFLVLFLIFIVLVQMVFIALFKSVRPQVKL